MKRSFQLEENVTLAPYTTLKIGGKGRYFVRAESEKAVCEAFNFAQTNDLQVFVLGGGSNILVSDRGFDGLVIQVALNGIRNSELRTDADSDSGPQNPIMITAAAGEDWDGLVAYCVENELAGIECMSGIPGFVGGTPVQNVGAYGQEVSETIVSVRCFDRKTGEFTLLTNADCKFAYRSSIFNSTHRDRFIVLNVTYALIQNGEPKIVYKDLEDLFGKHRPTLLETREAVLKIRRAKSMVIDANDENSRSAGSFFKNPIVSRQKLAEIASLAGTVPSFNVDQSTVKIPAAWLIENSGFHKGYRSGPVGISTNHTLALVNCGNASAGEILGLKHSIEAAVESKFGIILQPEPVFVGF